jgi:hypothetical protein
LVGKFIWRAAGRSGCVLVSVAEKEKGTALHGGKLNKVIQKHYHTCKCRLRVIFNLHGYLHFGPANTSQVDNVFQ